MEVPLWKVPVSADLQGFQILHYRVRFNEKPFGSQNLAPFMRIRVMTRGSIPEWTLLTSGQSY